MQAPVWEGAIPSWALLPACQEEKAILAGSDRSQLLMHSRTVACTNHHSSSMAEKLVELLGPTLKGKDGDVSTSEALAGKVVGIYFSGEHHGSISSSCDSTICADSRCPRAGSSWKLRQMAAPRSTMIAVSTTCSHVEATLLLVQPSLAAHWCPPCRGFTPKLADYYRKVTGADKNLEIVFVSFDRSVDSLRWFNT
jgi:hypothetical protein